MYVEINNFEMHSLQFGLGLQCSECCNLLRVVQRGLDFRGILFFFFFYFQQEFFFFFKKKLVSSGNKPVPAMRVYRKGTVPPAWDKIHLTFGTSAILPEVTGLVLPLDQNEWHQNVLLSGGKS